MSATESAGVASGLTVETAEALYGTSAPQICDALDGGVSSAESLLLTGNPAGRRGKVVTTDAITYERLVVQTYCPDQLSTYDDLVVRHRRHQDHEVAPAASQHSTEGNRATWQHEHRRVGLRRPPTPGPSRSR